MEIIQYKTKKTIAIIMLLIMIMSIATPVFAATIYTGSISKGDQLKFTGTSWTIYKTETAAKNLDKSNTNGTLKQGQTITVKAKSGNVLQIGTNQYIYYGSTGAKNFTKVTSSSNTPAKVETPAKTETKVEIPSSGQSSGLLEIGGAIVGGLVNVATSETTTAILGKIVDIIMNILKTVFSSLSGISIKVPGTVDPKIDVPSTSSEKVLKLSQTTATLKVGETLQLKATVDGKEVKPTYSYKGSVATVDKDGKVTAKEAGTTDINARYTYKDGSKNIDLTATCRVTVSAKSGQPSSGGGSTSTGGNNTISDNTLTKAINFISKFEGNKVYTINGVSCYKAATDTDGVMKCVGVSVSGVKSYGNNYYEKSGIDQKVKNAVKTSANIVKNLANQKGLNLTQNDIMAFTSFTYQCAGSNNKNINNVLTTYKEEGRKAAMERLLLYTKAGSKTLGGIVKRRNAEAMILMDGSYSGNYNNDTNSDLKYYKKVTEDGYEFSYSDGKSQLSSYKASLNAVR